MANRSKRNTENDYVFFHSRSLVSLDFANVSPAAGLAQKHTAKVNVRKENKDDEK